MVADMRSGTEPSGVQDAGQNVFVQGDTGDIVTDNGGPGWSVGAGQLPPTQITLFGRSPRTGSNANFTDSVDVRSTARQAIVPCSVQSVTDDHCFNRGSSYAEGTRLTGLHLFARDMAGREYANFYAMYQLNVAP
ncbi:hypothetical protein [Hydrogenophaga palleronii]|uniref:hypothetical protein n=1 Tax=Hydrogenophaga palleronii TaxID=65655 RepID=UPI0012EE3786|nr:hypothetical protein [Hydrogenophaga palleronii]